MKKLVHHPAWTLLLLLAAGLCMGLLSLWFAAWEYHIPMFKSYLTSPAIACLNLAPAAGLVLLLWCLTNRAWLSFLLGSAVVLGFTWVNYLKLAFRNDPLMFEDLLLAKEAGNMAGRYTPFLTHSMILALLLVLGGTALLALLARGKVGKWPRLGVLAFLLLCGLPLQSAILSSEVYTAATRNNDLINQWSATQVYLSKGFVYPFLYSVGEASDLPPDGYNEQRAKAMLAAYEDAGIPADRQVSVISIMLEAYNDFTKFDVPGLNPKVYADYHALEAESYTGNLITNIFAGGTVDTERCFLTGFSRLGSFRAPTNSFAWYFRSQGYTVQGSHPCYEWFYNRLNINGNLGFEDYFFLENHYAALADGGIALDDVFFPELIRLWQENKETGRPYFTFDLTYQGHGPYNTDVTWWGDDYITGGAWSQEERNLLNNYFGSIYNTNRNLVAFFDYFRAEAEPVVIVLFGDHNPWLGDGNALYHALGIDLDFSQEQGFYNYYGTRYLIWANDAAKAVLGNDFTGQGPDLGPYFLMGELFDLCGWEGPAFLQATNQLRARVPVQHTNGLYVEQGTLTDTLTPEGAALVDDYNQLQYYWRKHFDGD